MPESQAQQFERGFFTETETGIGTDTRTPEQRRRDSLVERINAEVEQGSMQQYRLGQMLFEAGIATRRSEGNLYIPPVMSESFRELSRHENLNVSATYLWQCVMVYDQKLFLELQEDAEVPEMSFSHQVELLAVKNYRHKLSALQYLVRNPGASVRQFREHINEYYRRNSGSSGDDNSFKLFSAIKGVSKVAREAIELEELTRAEFCKKFKIDNTNELISYQLRRWEEDLRLALEKVSALRGAFGLVETSEQPTEDVPEQAAEEAI